MIKLIKNMKKKAEERKNLKKYRQYYKVVKAGLVFIDFIQQDIADQKKKKINRAQRRRFEKDLNKEGKLTEEIVQHYKLKIDNVLGYIETKLNPPKPRKQPKKSYTKGTHVPVNSQIPPQPKKTPFNDDDSLKAEYKLIQEKKSNLPANERKKVVSLYKQKFGTK